MVIYSHVRAADGSNAGVLEVESWTYEKMASNGGGEGGIGLRYIKEIYHGYEESGRGAHSSGGVMKSSDRV